MVPNISLVKQEYFRTVNGSEILEEINEKMKVEITSKSGKLVRFFCEPTANREESRIKFLNVGNFPDGILLRFNEDRSVEVNICELKRTPSNDLKRLTRQLFAGYIHCKLLLKLLDIEDDVIKYHFNVFMIHDRNTTVEYNDLPSIAKKVVPGEIITSSSNYQLWSNGELKFVEKGYEFNFRIDKHRLILLDESQYYINLEV